ncbi:RDD family protein [Aliarcobacter skirrowii]|uniref:RDD family protein n=1 Tax=Aliarcobacter skirrowii TaxID=28200 RepID=UPI0029BA9653|nr:RDD family protein [Aliarcobacter skirrowii]MDX4063756.1 RDD family protein [Aliarcobacter skirrowii]MDX4071297.1 RDD family protein [Aliarcobacter skirrowii]
MQNSENLQLASMRSRAFAFVIDDLIVTLLISLVYWDSIVAAGNNTEALISLLSTLVLPLLVLKIIYHTFFIWYYGQTLGKRLAKVRVIDANHWGRVTLFQSFLRAVGRVISELFYYIGFAIAFFNDGRKTFHDFTGKTLVVDA